jgi:hypothetical protein
MKFRNTGRACQVFAGLVLFSLAAAPAFAKEPKTPEPAAAVIGHIAIEGPPATKMFLQQDNSKEFLYIDQGTKQGYTVVDVTKPSKPSIVNHMESGQLRIMPGDVGIAVSSDSDTKTVTRSHPPTESVKLLDLSDPAHPKTVQSFTGVTAVLRDDSHNLVYLTNNDGLWILKHMGQQIRPPKKLPPCTSEAAIQAMPPDCE